MTNQFANTNTPLRETHGPCEYPQPYISRMKQSISHWPEYLSIKSSKILFSNITHTNLKQQANHIHMNSIQPSILPSSSKHLLNNVHNLCLARALLPGLDNFDSSLEKIDAQIGIWIRAWGWKRGIWHKCSFERKATMETKTRRARDELRCWENECTKEEKGSMRLTTKDTCSSIFNLTFSCILHLLRWILQSSYSGCLLSQQITYLLIRRSGIPACSQSQGVKTCCFAKAMADYGKWHCFHSLLYAFEGHLGIRLYLVKWNLGEQCKETTRPRSNWCLNLPNDYKWMYMYKETKVKQSPKQDRHCRILDVSSKPSSPQSHTTGFAAL